MSKFYSFTKLTGFSLFVSILLVLSGATVSYYLTKKGKEKLLLEQDLSRRQQLKEQSELIHRLNTLLSSKDTLTLRSKQTRKLVIDSFDHLKTPEDYGVSVDNQTSKDETTNITMVGLALAFVTLAGLIAEQFLSSFKNNARNKSDKNHASVEVPFSDSENYKLLEWIVENHLINSTGNIDLEKARLWKTVYDLGIKLGDENVDLIVSVQNLLETELTLVNSEESQRSNLFNVFEEIQTRLKQECGRLNNQALLNLFIGFFLAFSLLGFSLYVVLTTNFGSIGQLKLETFILMYFPRILLVISILTMFLYFIRLYKTNVIDVKYYQNEITNVEIKLASLRLALLSNNQDVINVLVKDLSNIERNPFMNKDQSSLEIERLKLENEMTKDFLSKTYDFFGNLKERFITSGTN